MHPALAPLEGGDGSRPTRALLTTDPRPAYPTNPEREGAMNDALATPQQVADYLGTTTGALAQKRYLGIGPKFIKLGQKTVRYRWADVEAYVNESVVETAAS